MSFAYADPPYPGLAKRYYDDAEVDHSKLVDRLMQQYTDGWALSTSAKALPSVLAVCPPKVRVLAWFKWARGRSGWEPVIVYGGRRTTSGPLDSLLERGRQRSHPRALVGMKPAAFCEWVFRWLGARRGDLLHDVFPGSGAVKRAWRLYQGKTPVELEPSSSADADTSRGSANDRNVTSAAAATRRVAIDKRHVARARSKTRRFSRNDI